MPQPAFWQHRGWAAQALRPLAALTAHLTARRVARGGLAGGLALGIPVICVGNINAGGTGKTPTVMALVQRLVQRGARPFIVSRGYGGRMAGPVQVDPARHSATDVGDEPLLLAAFAPVVIARDRAAGGQLAMSLGADVIVLDDGLQNPSLHKDFSLVVVDAMAGFGNGLCLPAGPLREPVAAGLARANMVLSIGAPTAQAGFLARHGAEIAALPHVTAQLAPLPMGIDWQGAKVVAFAGIGRPDKFFATLRSLGAQLIHAEALPDHAPLPPALLARLWEKAQAQGANLVTTEKDAVRLPPQYRADVISLPVRLHLDDWQVIDSALDAMGLGNSLGLGNGHSADQG